MRLLCVPGARGGVGRGPGPGSPLAAARGWARLTPHLAGAGVAASGAGREHGPGPAELGAPVGKPRRLGSGPAARPGPSHQAKPKENGDKVRPGGPAPTTS